MSGHTPSLTKGLSLSLCILSSSSRSFSTSYSRLCGCSIPLPRQHTFATKRVIIYLLITHKHTYLAFIKMNLRIPSCQSQLNLHLERKEMNSLRYLDRVSSTLSLTLVAGMVNKKCQKVGEEL